MCDTLPPGELPLVTRARLHGRRIAVEAEGENLSYAELLGGSEGVARRLLAEAAPSDGARDLAEARVAFLVKPGPRYPIVQWGIWRGGGVAVPLALSHPEPELAFVLDDSEPVAVVADRSLEERIAPLSRERDIPLLRAEELTASVEDLPLPALASGRRAMILYTSGTTGRPKGVVSTHANLESQITSLVEAWGWSPDDRILHVLPLHHAHGILNVLSCPLWAGASCHMLDGFDVETTWQAICQGDFTLFMAVPTIYRRLSRRWDEASEGEREAFAKACRDMRLMVSGSAALPVSLLERWAEITGHVLLERYGMTEIGMALSNPLRGERRPGYVGGPLPGVQVRIVTGEGKEAPEGTAGEIQVRGGTVFLEYWRRPAETEAHFRNGWFLTGDEGVVEEGSFRILGRRSVDIIKTGGYKVSALEVEQVVGTHPGILECAVVGVPDPEWGERVAAAYVPARGVGAPREVGALEESELRDWTKERLAPYKAPSLFLSVRELPRNAMGKVTKSEVRSLFQGGREAP